MRIRLRDRISDEALSELDPQTWALVMDAEAEIEMNDPTGGVWSGDFTFSVNGNEAWNELERLFK